MNTPHPATQAFTIRILGLNTGNPTPYDGEWLIGYDPTLHTLDPWGRLMTARLITTPDRAQARRFTTVAEAHALWCATSGRTRPDGQPDRPLLAFTVELESDEP